jgi:hypothetical protein
MLENGVLECLKSIQWRFSRVNKDSTRLQGVKKIKMLQDELKDDGVVENKSLGLQLKMMTKAFVLRWFKCKRINSQRMG